MNLIDLIFLLILIGLSVFGYKKGLIKEAGAILSLLISLLAAYFFSGPFSTIVARYIHAGESMVHFISFLIIIVGGTIGLYAVFMIFKKIIDLTVLGVVDRLLGLLLGVIKTFVLLFVVYTLLMWKPIYNATKETVDTSISIKLMKKWLPTVEKYWNVSYNKIKNSKELKENVQKTYDRSVRVPKNTRNH